MAKSASTQGTQQKKTTNAVVFGTSWGAIYIPKSVAEGQLGDPVDIEVTVTVKEG